MPVRNDKKAAPQRRQVAALPVKVGEDGALRVLLITSRETRRWVTPKGWPMKTLADHQAAAREAEEEAGVVGRVSKKPVGRYLYFKRDADGFHLSEVAVYRLDVQAELAEFREKGQRDLRWCTIEEAARLVVEPGLAAIIAGLARRVP